MASFGTHGSAPSFNALGSAAPGSFGAVPNVGGASFGAVGGAAGVTNNTPAVMNNGFVDPASNVSRPLIRPHGGRGSSFGSGSHGPRFDGNKVDKECRNQHCAEEECDPDECGDENRPPRDDNHTCGIDRRPLLPVVLVLSTMIGASHMMMLEFPMIRDLWDGAYCIRATFLILYALTIGCMAYCTCCDPGELKEVDQRKANARAKGLSEDSELPARCHKSWLYKMPVRRYDHYCRWVTNCIGLLNHREFIVMCTGLVCIGFFGALLDLFLIGITAQKGGDQWLVVLFLAMHLTYSVILTGLAGPILKLHVGFISRNELANEWKRNDNYVVQRKENGQTVHVNELTDDEFNDRFDAFEYDKTRNKFDKDVSSNCWTFWCTPRWAPGQVGEF